MNDPTVVIIGAGAMGGILAAALARGGARLSIIDTDAEHVAAINRDGLCPQDFGPTDAVRVSAATTADTSDYADLVVIMTPAYEVASAAKTARKVLKATGAAVSCQNGLGNAEALIAELGDARVFMGSTRSSADRPEPGCPRATKIDPTTVGEFDGTATGRATWFAETATRGGLPTVVSDNIMGVLWSKFLHNCAVNAICATTGLRQAEVARDRALEALRDQLLQEGLAVARAKGIDLEKTDPQPHIRQHMWQKYTQPSMLQMVEAGRPIEIDAINGWLVREADELGIDVPANRVITALARGRAQASRQSQHMAPNYAALSAEAQETIALGEAPWQLDRTAASPD
ncbi:MAG: ketopantoate reductase family protein [Pseudomonadota bacterium]